MYAKIYSQIFNSSIAEDWQTRHVFEDLIKLADRHGHVDMTPEAISRQTNVPLDVVTRAMAELQKPDPRSRSRNEEGRRIVLVDPARDWGWKIVNHGYYRQLKCAEDKREQDADRQRRYRAGADQQQEDGETERPPAKIKHPAVGVSKADPKRFALMLSEVLVAYKQNPLAPATMGNVQQVRANISELLAMQVSDADWQDHLDFCASSYKFRPKDEASATDPKKWSKWRSLADDAERERKEASKRGRR
jgi:hypothetical protein